MRHFNGLDWFLGAAYNSTLSTALLRDVVAPLRERLEPLPYEVSAVANEVSRWLQGATAATTPLGTAEEARLVVLRDDISRIATNVVAAGVVKDLERRRDYASFMASTLDSARAEMSNVGLDLKSPTEVFFVDEFPAPYNSRDAAIIACDEGDLHEFGIPPGLYIGPGFRPFYTEFIVFHEVVHVYLGSLSPQEFAGRLEEGWAEVLGAGWLSLQFMPPDLVLNLFVLNRLSSQYAGQWERYLDATRQVWALVQRFGFQQIVEWTMQGRPKLSDLEAKIMQGLGREWHPSTGRIPPDLGALLSAVCDTYPRSLVCSPAAFLAAPHAHAGATVREIAASAGMSQKLTIEALEELQDALGLLALRPDRSVVPFSVAPEASSSGRLRVDLGSDER